MSEQGHNSAEQEAKDARLMDILYGEGAADIDALDAAERSSLEEFRGLRSLFSQLEDENPPLSLSHRLQAAAAAEVSKSSAPALAGGGWFQRLIRPFAAHPGFAAAASLVVVAGVAGAIFIGGEHRMAEPSLGRADSAASRVAPKAFRESSPVTPTGDAPTEDAKRELAAGDEGELDRLSQGFADDPEPAAEPPPPPAETKPTPRARAKRKESLARPMRSAGSKSGKIDDALGDLDFSSGGENKAGLVGGGSTATTPSRESKKKAPASAKEESAPEQKPSSPEALRLHRQATAAAKKGDCDQALALAAKIRALDARYYDTTLLSDPAIRACRRSGDASKK